MATYKTPDVYVEEISLLPPSVAQVETAIPCFIGYTEKAEEVTENDLYLKAKKVTSLVEYQQFFGGEPPLDAVKVVLDSNNAPISADLNQQYYLFDSLRLFFDNGGGPCYIISVGLYGESVLYGDTTEGMRGGLEVLKRKDEPTIICFPDAVLLGESKLYTLQQQALMQCAELMDRVLVCDLPNSATNENDNTNFDKDVSDFRNKIGINNLKYGAAYTPWLRASLTKNISFSGISIYNESDTELEWTSIASDKEVLQLIKNLEYALELEEELQTSIVDAVVTSLATDPEIDSLVGLFQEKVTEKKATILDGSAIPAGIETLFGVLNEMAEAYNNYYDDNTTSVVEDASMQTQEYSFRSEMENALALYGVIDQFQVAIYYAIAAGVTVSLEADLVTNWEVDIDETTTEYTAIESLLSGITEAADQGKAVYDVMVATFGVLDNAISALFSAAAEQAEIFDGLLYDSFATYKTIVDKAKSELMELPPSGAIAGIYAQVDNLRGVHKAPANVSLNSVNGLTVSIDSQEQEGLNVDANAGKSINAIRYFTGKGILVWGARTLAGNDNEWRYISVRRFYNTVEESIKKSTYWAVFEPNDANTWVRVKAMIENYLRQKWSEGALMGAVAEDAFFVKVGLGETMTSQDVLEGRMNVQIGMSVVRPAEFIILKFSHFMQDA